MRRTAARSAGQSRSRRSSADAAALRPRSSRIAIAIAAIVSARRLHARCRPAAVRHASTDTTPSRKSSSPPASARRICRTSRSASTSSPARICRIWRSRSSRTTPPRRPSISFVSAGPGTQTFVMRGVSDGSNPNYSNTATTAFLVDDMSMNFYGTTPDLHLYDIERIEVLNGPQGTTFGAGAMAGALRFITNKPDADRPSARGIDTDDGKIDGGTHNGTIEGFVNMPLIDDWTAMRLSGVQRLPRRLHQQLDVTTRTWVNGTVSNNSAMGGQRLQHREGRGRPPGHRPEDRRRLEGHADLRAISASSRTAPGTRIRPSAARSDYNGQSGPTVPRARFGHEQR